MENLSNYAKNKNKKKDILNMQSISKNDLLSNKNFQIKSERKNENTDSFNNKESILNLNNKKK